MILSTIFDVVRMIDGHHGEKPKWPFSVLKTAETREPQVSTYAWFVIVPCQIGDASTDRGRWKTQAMEEIEDDDVHEV